MIYKKKLKFKIIKFMCQFIYYIIKFKFKNINIKMNNNDIKCREEKNLLKDSMIKLIEYYIKIYI